MGIFKKVGGKIIDVRADKWMSLGYLQETTERFKFILRDIAVPKKATHSETFEEAMQRLELTEEDVTQRKKEFIRLFYFFVALAICVIGYAMYLAFKGALLPSLIAFCMALYGLTQAFRFHFWHFQLKNRKLGCTIKEWMNSKIVSVPSKAISPQVNSPQTPESNKNKAEE